MYQHLTDEQQFFHETAKDYVALAKRMNEAGRRAKAQEFLQEARYYLAKVPAEYTERELMNNLENLHTKLFRGY